MAIIRVTPTEVRVECDWFDGSPRRVQLGAEPIPVTEIEGIREESAAYPVLVGPRTIFQVRTPGARLRLAYEHRRRRWLVEGLEALASAGRSQIGRAA